MNGQRELVNSSLLASKIKDPDLGVWDSTVKPALGVRLVLAVAIALGWSSTHLSEIVRQFKQRALAVYEASES